MKSAKLLAGDGIQKEWGGFSTASEVDPSVFRAKKHESGDEGVGGEGNLKRLLPHPQLA